MASTRSIQKNIEKLTEIDIKNENGGDNYGGDNDNDNDDEFYDPIRMQGDDDDVDDADADDEFYDAVDIQEDARPMEITLKWSIQEAQRAISYFFNNKFKEAECILTPYITESMYHSMGKAVFSFLEAILTFEQKQILEASKQVDLCLGVCQVFKKKKTVVRRFRKVNYVDLSDSEAHAELCYGEALLLKALLSFIEDESLTNFLRGGMKIRQCFNIFKECALILNQKSWETTESRYHFESGVCMGLGAFKLMISLLPTGVIRILEFIGFSGNKQLGLRDLYKGYNLPGLRQVLCAIALLGYNLIVCYVLLNHDGDLELCNQILNNYLKQYPQGVWFLFFKGRLEFMKGNLDTAIEYYKISWKSQIIWPQFHHLSFWELLWIHCLKLDWEEAKLYSTLLLENSKWSKTIYCYQKAAIMLMSNKADDGVNQEIEFLMKEVPLYKQRLAGKSLPMEKFVCKKAKRYLEENKNICLPAIELMYLWNTFKILNYNQDSAKKILNLIESQKLIYENKTLISYDFDNYALCLLLAGTIYRNIKKFDMAIRYLNQCLTLQREIKEDKYIMAYSHFEKAMTLFDQGDYKTATILLEECKRNYKSYSLEARLQFRIHNVLTEIKERT